MCSMPISLITLFFFFFFFFNDTATTEIYTLSLHDALPISHVADGPDRRVAGAARDGCPGQRRRDVGWNDRADVGDVRAPSGSGEGADRRRCRRPREVEVRRRCQRARLRGTLAEG